MLALLVLTLGFLLSSQSRLQLKAVIQRTQADKAQAAADGGLVYGLAQLARDPAYSGTSKALLLDQGPETFTLEVAKAGSLLKDGRKVPEGCLYVTAVGEYPQAPLRRSSALIQVKTGGTSTGLPGMFVETLVLTGGSWVDSYDSRKGAYRTGANNGSVATNSVKAGSIRLQGGSNIKGPVSVGPEGLVEEKPAQYTTNSQWTVWRDWGTTYASAALMQSPMQLPPVEFPSKPNTTDRSLTSTQSSLPPGTYRDVTVSQGARLELQPGTYVFRNLTLQGGAKVDLAGGGPVKFYVEKKFDLSNGVKLSSSEVPAESFQLYLADGAVFDQSGGTDMTGIVYGPGARIQMSNSATVFGSVVGKEVTLTGAARVHYDEALSQFKLAGGAPNSGPAGIVVLFRQKY